MGITKMILRISVLLVVDVYIVKEPLIIVQNALMISTYIMDLV